MKNPHSLLEQLSSPSISLLISIFFVAAIASSVVGSDPFSSKEGGRFGAHIVLAQSVTLAQPTMSAVQCASDGRSVKLSWGSVSGADEYAVRVDDPTNNSSSCTEGWYCGNTQDYKNDRRSGTTLSRNTTPGKQYQWWVQAKKKDTWVGASTYTKVSFTCKAATSTTPPPTCSLSASPNPTAVSSPVTLTKSSTNATSATLNGVATSTFGTTRVTPAVTTTYTMNVAGAGGTGSCNVTVMVPPPPTNMVASCTGNQLTFRWTPPSGYTHFYTRVSSGGTNLTSFWNEDYVGTSQTLTVTAGQKYTVWVHTRASNGAWSSALFSPEITCSTTTPQCTPDATSPQTQTLTCPIGQTGSITQTRTSSCPAGATTPVWSAWTTTSNTCTPIVQCTPDATSPQTQTLACPAGQTGSITQQRTSSCPAGATTPVWSSWTTTSSTCAPISTSTAPSVQPTTVPTKVLSALGNSSPLIDFLIQDVCINSQNHPIKGDPATCSAHRDIKFGEMMPYLRTNYSAVWRWSYNSSINYPVQAPDGSLLIMKTMEYGGGATQPVGDGTLVTTQFRDYERYLSGMFEGYDLHEANGTTASFIATQVNGYYPFWRPGCGHDDTWTLYPFNLSKGAQGVGFPQIAFGNTCPQNYITTRNSWSYNATPYTYASGKTLETIYTYVENIDASGVPYPGSHIETFYFTKEYGNAKWESWFETTDATVSAAAKAEALSKCGGAGTKVFGSRTLVLGACEDWTYTKDFDVAFNPLTYSGGRDLVLSKNLLTFGDFAGSKLDGWQTVSNGLQLTVPTLVLDAVTKNAFLTVTCPYGCSGTGMYQDVSPAGLSGTLTMRFGALMKANKTTQATLALFATDTSGGVQSTLVPITLGTTWQNFGSTYPVNFTAKPIANLRYQIYINDSTALYSLDEAYLVPSK